MSIVGRGIRRGLVAPLLVLMWAPGVAMSILDRAEFSQWLAIEAPGHHPDHGLPGHNHALCIQVRANPPVPTLGVVSPQPGPTLWFAPTQTPPTASVRSFRATHHPRAPPWV